jgi:hypothetical protein
MKRSSFIAGLAGAFAISGAMMAAPVASASEALPAGVALKLDGQAADFTMTAARERRLMIIENTNRRIAGRGAYGHAPGYGGRPYSGRGYERPGYGPRAGYRRGYYD